LGNGKVAKIGTATFVMAAWPAFSDSAGCHGDLNYAAHGFNVPARRAIFVGAVNPLASIDFQLLEDQPFRRQLQKR
jgi:hypothetical protein